ncbi:MAG: transporter substrate-binding domain-containing protein [Alphaproteobacteria bacterium]|nr:transporter substrate-binding domain-containing protein [Rhodospirillales bacterium]MCW9045837.1 transporter substrate-binding domain-containing protein [Alphaproteobacteria bacterium]
MYDSSKSYVFLITWLKKIFFSFLGTLFLLSTFPAKAETPSLRVLVQKSKPKFFLYEAGRLGLCDEIYLRLKERLSARGINLKIDANYTPIKRILLELEKGLGDGFCGAGRNAAREARVIYSTNPIYVVSNVVATQRDNPTNPKSFQDLAKEGVTVGAYFGTASATFLKKQKGVKVDDHFKTLKEGLERVSLGKLTYFYYHDLGLNYLVKNLPYLLRVVPTKFRTINQWMIYSKETPEHLRKAMDHEISEMIKSGEMDKIHAKFFIP